ncbi:MAG TPA: DUF4159 domain-containing protein [Lacipirellulaceae bacterium]|nr:DUF4159 domain-containing protein [Lacipirellulaceae bacterium]
MTRRSALLAAAVVVAVAAGGAALAQWGGRPWDDGDPRRGVPDWENDPAFANDVFTFVRVVYNEDRGYGRTGRRGRRGWGGGWRTDWPDSDLNFSFRLQQLTSLKVNPEPIYLPLTDPRLFDYPFLYMIEPGNLLFTEEEVLALRKYLLSGGFLMVDDFWGDSQWENFYEQIKRVFPDREPVELPIEHEIFNIVYRLKEKPQVPSINAAMQGRPWGIDWEQHDGDSRTVHYRALFDDKGRMMSIICHNTDLGDGWEREGEDPWFFTEFAEKKAYPMGINIVVYAMTH